METINQTNRTLLLDVINPDKQDLLTLVGDVKGLDSLDDDKMKVLRIFASNIADPENYEAILDIIDSLFKKDDAKKILGIRY